jgi:hypothetical protein
VQPTTLREVVVALRELVELLKGDLRCRFANTGILAFLYILHPAWEEPGPGLPGSSQAALSAWARHFALDLGLLTQQFMAATIAKAAHVRSSPQTAMLSTHEFWPPLLVRMRGTAPELFRCIATFLVLAWQNAQVERDLAIIGKVSARSEGALGQSRLDSRCRAAIDGPEPTKERQHRVRGVIKTVTKEWCLRQRRQRAPGVTGPRGAQGAVPSRGQRRPPGPLVQAVATPGRESRAAAGEPPRDELEQDADVGALL